MLVVPNTGEVIALSYLVNKYGTTENLVYGLFTNNITPAETDTLATYTEAAGGGYASIALTGANWTVTGGAPSAAAYAQQTWNFSGALTGNATIYGYFAKRATSGDLVLAETFTPFTPAASGDQIKLTPQITAD
ncbi:hypothetical protein [Massilia sp. DD77]|uniref:hypothetical protein n=1 Tax=Massilia sp. DD77 TaxID=3109349 RepID=UPI002FFDC76D